LAAGRLLRVVPQLRRRQTSRPDRIAVSERLQLPRYSRPNRLIAEI
jgi:hypothetical protein